VDFTIYVLGSEKEQGQPSWWSN